jgi:hypothetical protein
MILTKHLYLSSELRYVPWESQVLQILELFDLILLGEYFSEFSDEEFRLMGCYAVWLL